MDKNGRNWLVSWGIPGVALTLTLTGTSAAAADDRGFYVGVAAGGSLLDANGGQINQIAVASGFTSASSRVDDTDIGWKVFGGYRVIKYLALEASYVDLGEASFVTTTTGPNASIRGKAEGDGFHLQAVGIIPYTDAFFLHAKAGAFWWDVDARVARLDSGVPTNASVSESVPTTPLASAPITDSPRR